MQRRSPQQQPQPLAPEPVTITIQECLELAVQHQVNGRHDEANNLYSQILTVEPNNPVALQLMGMVAHAENDNDTAFELISKAISFAPDYFEAHNNIGLVLKELRRLDEAAESFSKAIALQNQNPSPHYNLGWIHMKQKRYDEAIVCLEKAIALQPQYAEAYANLGLIYNELGEVEKSVASCRQSIRYNPNDFEAYLTLAKSLSDAYEYEEAEVMFRKTLSINSSLSQTWIGLGTALRRLGRLDESIAVQEAEIARKPDYAPLHWNISLSYLQRGDLKKGWEEYDWGLKLSNLWDSDELSTRARVLKLDAWEGESLEGKNLLVYGEQGVGDEILFASCLPDLNNALADNIYVECDPRLGALFTRAFPNVQVCGKDRDDDHSWVGENVELDCCVPIGRLPKFFRNQRSDFPQRSSYLTADQKELSKWKQRLAELGEKPKIGISWRGGSERVLDMCSIPLTQWASLLSLDATFVNLQYGSTSDEIKQLYSENGLVLQDWDDNNPRNDLDGLAGLLSALDLVISIDNATVHLSGALGVPVWDVVDMRFNPMWFEQGDRTPVHASVRLFEKSLDDEWSDVLGRVEHELRQKFKL